NRADFEPVFASLRELGDHGKALIRTTGRAPLWHQRDKGRIGMRKYSLMMLAAAFGLAASQASAADLPRKAPAYIPPAPLR
ncbi:MAG: hypothetical protein WCD65_19470, partial [Pseudolabrys sp.]